MKSIPNKPILIIALIWLLWMDACLYINIQQQTWLNGGNTVIVNNDHNINNDSKINSYNNNYNRDTNSNLAQPNQPLHKESLKQTSDNGTMSNYKSKIHPIGLQLVEKFSFAFEGMSVKLMMTDPVDNYLLAPLSEIFIHIFGMKDNLLFITPNVVSYLGVVCAVIGGILLTYHKQSSMQRLSVLMFQMRTWLDDLDGALARVRMGIETHESLENTSGYIVDGVCDAIGFAAYLFGCYILLIKLNSSSKRDDCSDTRNISHFDSTYVTLPHSENLNSKQQAIKTQSEDTQTIDISDIEQKPSHLSTSQGKELVMTDTCDHCDQRSHSDSNDDSDEDILYEANCNDNSNLISRKRAHGNKDDHCENNQKYFYYHRKQNSRTLILCNYIKEKFNPRKGSNQRRRKGLVSNGKICFVLACFVLQICISALFWNRYILLYRDLLDTNQERLDNEQVYHSGNGLNNNFLNLSKISILKSNVMFIFVWFWRLTNGHSLMQMLIISICMKKLWPFLNYIKYIGFLEIILLASLTELHTRDIRSYLQIF